MTYINKDYYDYITKIDNEYSPLHNTYTKILKILLKEGLDKPLSAAAKDNFLQVYEIRKYKLKEEKIDELDHLLYYDCAFRRVFKNDSGSFSIYPSLKELPNKNDLLIYYSLGLKMNVSEIVDYLTPLCNTKIAMLKNAKMENYYGSPKYLILHTKAIYDAIVMLNNRSDIEDKTLVSNAILNVSDLLKAMLNIGGLENTEETYNKLNDFYYTLPVSKNEYDSMRRNYEKVLELENTLVPISNAIWQRYAQEHNGVFIHQLTQEIIESDKMTKICTSFYSDKANYITEYFNANTGYAYPMDISSVFEICEGDVGSWSINQEEFIERGFPETWQLDGTNLWYEYPHHSKLFPPEYIESIIVNNHNFAEIIIDNRFKKVKPLYCFYTPKATPEQIAKITEMAKYQGLEVKPLMIEKIEINSNNKK